MKKVISRYLSPETYEAVKSDFGRWDRFLIKKTDLVNKLLEKFEEMAKYIK